MAKKHDENKDLRCLMRTVRIDFSNKTLQAPKSATIGIRSWGRIDFLTKYCGWHFIWNNSVTVATRSEGANKPTKAAKKEAKAPKLSDKTKKQSKKK